MFYTLKKFFPALREVVDAVEARTGLHHLTQQ